MAAKKKISASWATATKDVMSLKKYKPKRNSRTEKFSAFYASWLVQKFRADVNQRVDSVDFSLRDNALSQRLEEMGFVDDYYEPVLTGFGKDFVRAVVARKASLESEKAGKGIKFSGTVPERTTTRKKKAMPTKKIQGLSDRDFRALLKGVIGKGPSLDRNTYFVKFGTSEKSKSDAQKSVNALKRKGFDAFTGKDGNLHCVFVNRHTIPSKLRVDNKVFSKKIIKDTTQKKKAMPKKKATTRRKVNQDKVVVSNFKTSKKNGTTYTNVTGTKGNKTVKFLIVSGLSNYLNVTYQNASNRAYKGRGKEFDSFKSALANYKSADIKDIIRTVNNAYAEKIKAKASATSPTKKKAMPNKKKATTRRKTTTRKTKRRASRTSKDENMRFGVAIDATVAGKKCRKLHSTHKTDAKAKAQAKRLKGRNPRAFKINPQPANKSNRKNVCQIEPLRWGIVANVGNGRKYVATFRLKADADREKMSYKGKNPRVSKIF